MELRIEKLNLSLSEAIEHTQTKQNLVDELQKTKDALSSQLAAIQTEVESAQIESRESVSQLAQVQEEVGFISFRALFDNLTFQ